MKNLVSDVARLIIFAFINYNDYHTYSVANFLSHFGMDAINLCSPWRNGARTHNVIRMLWFGSFEICSDLRGENTQRNLTRKNARTPARAVPMISYYICTCLTSKPNLRRTVKRNYDEKWLNNILTHDHWQRVRQPFGNWKELKKDELKKSPNNLQNKLPLTFGTWVNDTIDTIDKIEPIKSV